MSPTETQRTNLASQRTLDRRKRPRKAESELEHTEDGEMSWQVARLASRCREALIVTTIGYIAGVWVRTRLESYFRDASLV